MEVSSFHIEVPKNPDHRKMLSLEIIRQQILAEYLGLSEILDYYMIKSRMFRQFFYDKNTYEY